MAALANDQNKAISAAKGYPCPRLKGQASIPPHRSVAPVLAGTGAEGGSSHLSGHNHMEFRGTERLIIQSNL